MKKCTKVMHWFSFIMEFVFMAAIIWLAIIVLSIKIDSMPLSSVMREPLWVLRAFVGVFGVAGFFLIVAIMSEGKNIFSQQISAGYSLIKNGKVERSLEQDEYFWNGELKNYEIFTPFEPVVHTHTQPITANPKIRNIAYSVKTKVANVQTNYNHYNHSRPTSKELSNQFLNKNIYDFNEYCSKELANFFNPLEKKQQADFFKLTSKYLNPRLNEIGLAVAEAHFNLN